MTDFGGPRGPNGRQRSLADFENIIRGASENTQVVTSDRRLRPSVSLANLGNKFWDRTLGRRSLAERNQRDIERFRGSFSFSDKYDRAGRDAVSDAFQRFMSDQSGLTANNVKQSIEHVESIVKNEKLIDAIQEHRSGGRWAPLKFLYGIDHEISPFVKKYLMDNGYEIDLSFWVDAKEVLQLFDGSVEKTLKIRFEELQEKFFPEDKPTLVHLGDEAKARFRSLRIERSSVDNQPERSAADNEPQQPEIDKRQLLEDALGEVESFLRNKIDSLLSDILRQGNLDAIERFRQRIQLECSYEGFDIGPFQDIIFRLTSQSDLDKVRLTGEMRKEIQNRLENRAAVEAFKGELIGGQISELKRTDDVIVGYSPGLVTGKLKLTDDLKAVIRDRLENRRAVDSFMEQLVKQGNIRELVDAVIRRLYPKSNTGAVVLMDQQKANIIDELSIDRQYILEFHHENDNPGIHKVLNDAIISSHFGAFARSSLSGENYDFYISAMAALELGDQNRVAFDRAFQEICEGFIGEDSARQINISNNLARGFFYEGSDKRQILRSTLDEVIIMLLRDTFPKFTQYIARNFGS